jgi:hypothetical protein
VRLELADGRFGLGDFDREVAEEEGATVPVRGSFVGRGELELGGLLTWFLGGFEGLVDEVLDSFVVC